MATILLAVGKTIAIMRALQLTLHYLRCDLRSMTRTTPERIISSIMVLPWKKIFSTHHMQIRRQSQIDINTKPSIDAHHTPNSEVQVKDNTYYGYLTPDESGIFRDPEGQARAMDGHILNIFREEIAEIMIRSGSRRLRE